MPDERNLNPKVRRAQRVLLMVHELHKLGYQNLRIVPGMSPSGTHWRCGITPVSNISTNHGALPESFERDMVNYSSGMENNYFGWEDAKNDTTRQLAAKFIECFPEIARKGLGPDWYYAGWYVEMLGFADKGIVPVAHADWYGDPPRYLAKEGKEGRELPFPPLPVSQPNNRR